jgi:threonine dehydratase
MSRESVREVVASSTGNHGAAVAYAATQFGIKARIFLPANCNPVKRDRIALFGAAIVESGENDLASAFALAAEYAKQPGVYFLNDATDADLPAGPATIGCEILEQLPKTSAILVPMGDTALIRGIAAAVKQIAPQVKIIGVQAERAPSYCLSWKESHSDRDMRHHRRWIGDERRSGKRARRENPTMTLPGAKSKCCGRSGAV